MWGKVQDVLTFNLPAGAGFTAGCFYGMGVSAASALQLGALYGIGGKFGGPIANALSNMATPAALEVLKENVIGSVFEKISMRSITDRFDRHDVLFHRQLQVLLNTSFADACALHLRSHFITSSALGI